MSICIHCGAVIPKNADCCDYCGQPADSETSSRRHANDFDQEFHSEDTICSGCRSSVDSERTICPHCGKRLRYGFQSPSIRFFADQIRSLESNTSAHSFTAEAIIDALISMFSIKLVIWFFISIACHAFPIFALVVFYKAYNRAKNESSYSITHLTDFIDRYMFCGDGIEVLEGLTFIRDRLFDLKNHQSKNIAKQFSASLQSAAGRLYGGCNEHLAKDTSRLIDTIYFDIQKENDFFQK